ncbi:hypothetical protein CLAFUW4_09794 [Fulvia fulva]|uniref:RING-type domain-containing protein n=1 Tax=Passalora fulva TaxID=5499 RepID=A0A9Q8PII9_PASFU|nr:uncharacterized protein CLAFUR5_12444 [Fulvia fulva]KAK4616224.1 hypothetical protein CLAFUR4_09800 [Fulvia fulva]KAK4616402.1 hypothetical protein CLAFUR0_09793 [Fulvia fulva]UJO23062.1 hypothetical protein CLAFUR5_12444 [Fulvia fulva]WPV19075.1 hypothetical protein CLAFUW4_09794 [Fulvia fulva]WPV34400.1 hypothetical protein CLAFUW7_09797 [Fulvia fulva]
MKSAAHSSTVDVLQDIHAPVKTACDHTFCRECLTQRLEDSATCPECRNKLFEPEAREEEEEEDDDDRLDYVALVARLYAKQAYFDVAFEAASAARLEAQRAELAELDARNAALQVEIDELFQDELEGDWDDACLEATHYQPSVHSQEAELEEDQEIAGRWSWWIPKFVRYMLSMMSHNVQF